MDTVDYVAITCILCCVELTKALIAPYPDNSLPLHSECFMWQQTAQRLPLSWFVIGYVQGHSIVHRHMNLPSLLTLNIPSLARQCCLPRRTPWFFCNFSTVWCGRLLKLCFLGFWNYNSV